MSALKDFKSSLTAVRELIGLEAGYGDPPDPGDRDVAYGLRGAATVLTLACFESFLSSLFEEELDRVVATRLPLRCYADKLRVEAIFSSLELAMKGDHATRGQERMLRLSNVMITARAVAADSFVPRALASTQSNPDSDTVKRMFKAVGRSAIFDDPSAFEQLWGAPVAATYCADTLDALVASRNRVAHTADAAHVSRSDMALNVHFVETLAEVLAADLAQHVSILIAEARSANTSAS